MKSNNNYIRAFAIFTSMLMLTIVAVPMVAAEDEYEYCDEAQSPITTDITLYDFCGAEIEIIDGLPFIIIESENECNYMLLSLFDVKDMIADDVLITVEVDGNYLLIPTEEGIKRVCISEFDVEIVEGQLMLVHEVNPIFTFLLGVTIFKAASFGWKLGQTYKVGTIGNAIISGTCVVIVGGLAFVTDTVTEAVLRRQGVCEWKIAAIRLKLGIL